MRPEAGRYPGSSERKKDEHVKNKWEFPGGRRQGLEDEKKTLDRAFKEVFRIETVCLIQ